MQEWEYISVKLPIKGKFSKKMDQNDLDRILNEFGKTGWEMIDSLSVTSSGTVMEMFAIFKREKTYQ